MLHSIKSCEFNHKNKHQRGECRTVLKLISAVLLLFCISIHSVSYAEGSDGSSTEASSNRCFDILSSGDALDGIIVSRIGFLNSNKVRLKRSYHMGRRGGYHRNCVGTDGKKKKEQLTTVKRYGNPNN